MADWLGFGGSLLSGGLSFLGGRMNQIATNRAARLNAIAQANENAISREFSQQQMAQSMAFQEGQFNQGMGWAREQFATQLAEAEKDRALQMEFAKHGLGWKIADARAAGISPLVALGAQTFSASPIQIAGASGPSPGSVSGGGYSPGSYSPFGGASAGTGMAAMGQDLSRAIQSLRSDEERQSAYTKTVQDLSTQKMALENELLASQIAKINQPGTPPAMPSATGRRSVAGQGNAPLSNSLVKDEALKRTAADPEKASQEAGAISDSGHSRTVKGWAPVMSKDVQERLEEDMIGTFAWNLRNRIMPSIGVWNKEKDPPFKAPEGREWYYHPIWQEYRLRKKSSEPRRSYRAPGHDNPFRMN